MTGLVETSSSAISSSLLFRTIRFCIALLVILLIVDGAFPQLQMFLTGNRVPISLGVLKVLLVCLLLAVAVLRGRVRQSPLLVVTWLMAAFLVIEVPFLHFGDNIGFPEIFIGYNGSFSIVLLAAVVSCLPLEIPEDLVSKTLMIVFVPCAILGIAQYILQQPIVPSASADDHFAVYAFGTQGGVGMRSFSFFTLPGRFGVYSAFIASLCAANIVTRRHLPISVVFLLLSGFCCYIAGSRSQFLTLSFALTTAVMIARGYGRRYIKWAPLVWFAISWIPFFVALQRLSAGGSAQGTGDTSSFGERILAWQYYLQDLGHKSVSQIMLGQGLIEYANAGTAETVVPVDNMYLGLIVHLGIVGTGIVLSLCWKIWRYVLQIAEEGGSRVAIACAGVVSSIFALGVFGNDISGVEIVLLALISLRYPKQLSAETQVVNARGFGKQQTPVATIS